MKKGGQTRKGSPPGGLKWSKSLQSKAAPPNAISWPDTEDECNPSNDGKCVCNYLRLHKISNVHTCMLKYLPIDKRIKGRKGTKYITEELIRRLSKCDNLALVLTLDLSTPMSNNKQFKVRFALRMYNLMQTV